MLRILHGVWLIDFIIQGNFEVSRQSLLLIESISSHLSDVGLINDMVLNFLKE